MPVLIRDAGAASRFAWEEFFYGTIRNPHTRVAYQRAINSFLNWCHQRNVSLREITPKLIGQYFDRHPGSPSTKKQHLAGIRHFFDVLVNRHGLVLNPAATVRGERYQVLEGKTPEITIEQARRLLHSIDATNLVGNRDRAIIAILIYTAARVGAVAKLRLKSFYFAGDQWCLHFDDKGGKSREIPVRHDLQQYLESYIQAVGLPSSPSDVPLFRPAIRREKRLTEKPMRADDISRMVKRRLKDVGLPSRISCHSFRVMAITDLLTQGVPLEDVQHLAGHSDSRTTALYDRRQKQVSRNIVERISV